MHLAHCFTLIIVLTLWERLQIWGKRRDMCKSGICNTKPALSLKRSSLEPLKFLSFVSYYLVLFSRTYFLTIDHLWDRIA